MQLIKRYIPNANTAPIKNQNAMLVVRLGSNDTALSVIISCAAGIAFSMMGAPAPTACSAIAAGALASIVSEAAEFFPGKYFEAYWIMPAVAIAAKPTGRMLLSFSVMPVTFFGVMIMYLFASL